MYGQAKRYITHSSELIDWCQKNQNCSILGIDTEFMRVKTYFPQLCLLQLSTQHEVVIIDAIKVNDLSPLIGLFISPHIVKIIHSGSQDIETLYNSLKTMPDNVFDTQIAALCLGFSEDNLLMGYQDIVHRLLNVVLEKDQTRTNWAQRPLSEAQLEYAYDDVRYLIALYDHLSKALMLGNHKDKFQSLIADLLNPQKYTPDFDTIWKKVVRRQKLQGSSLSLLKKLAWQRELLAIEHNLPKKWVLKDEDLIELSKIFSSKSTLLEEDFLLNHAVLKKLKREMVLQVGQVINDFIQKKSD